MSNNKPVYYFAYGSNLSFAQMRRRCPSSRPLGLAFLRDYTFIINGRGYANVVQNGADEVADDAGVYGVVYKIGPDDEASLDRCEGVPYAYTKEYMSVDFVRLHYREDVEAVAGLIPESEDASDIDGMRVLKRTHVLVYIDRERTSPGPPQPEYVERMSRGVEEASRLGLPKAYVTGSIGRWVPRLMIPTIYTAAAEDLASSSTA